jgi:hypothetical protein
MSTGATANTAFQFRTMLNALRNYIVPDKTNEIVKSFSGPDTSFFFTSRGSTSVMKDLYDFMCQSSGSLAAIVDMMSPGSRTNIPLIRTSKGEKITIYSGDLALSLNGMNEGNGLTVNTGTIGAGNTASYNYIPDSSLISSQIDYVVSANIYSSAATTLTFSSGDNVVKLQVTMPANTFQSITFQMKAVENTSSEDLAVVIRVTSSNTSRVTVDNVMFTCYDIPKYFKRYYRSKSAGKWLEVPEYVQNMYGDVLESSTIGLSWLAHLEEEVFTRVEETILRVIWIRYLRGEYNNINDYGAVFVGVGSDPRDKFFRFLTTHGLKSVFAYEGPMKDLDHAEKARIFYRITNIVLDVVGDLKSGDSKTLKDFGFSF